MNFINVLILGSVILFFLISIAFFIKRYLDNKEKFKSINQENTHELKRSLEDELKKKKEEELKKLESGDTKTINEVIERLFKSSKLGGWVKSQNYKLYNPKNISLVVNLSGKEELVNTKKEITLKSGEVYTQNKHYIAVKKEYSEKVFMSAYKIIEEIFTAIPTIYKVYLSLYLTEEESEKQYCVLSFVANRDQFRAISTKNNSVMEKIDSFSPTYDYDAKNYDFKEIEPISTPSGEVSLEKTMAMKASSNTTFFGGTVINPNQEVVSLKNEYTAPDNSKVSSDTKISSLSGSLSLDRTQLGLEEIFNVKEPEQVIESEDKSESEIDKFLRISGFKTISEENDNNLKIIKAVKSSEHKNYLIAINSENKIIKEDDLKSLFFKAIKDNIEKTVYITNGSFALDSVTYANVNNIELFDIEKINKLIN